MKHPINTWTLEYVESLRSKSACIGEPIKYIFTDNDRQLAIGKLRTMYQGRINPSFADRILILSELY